MATRSRTIAVLTGLSLLLLAGVLVTTYGKGLLYRYGWVLFVGIFAVALVARGVESTHHRRRMRAFRGLRR